MGKYIVTFNDLISDVEISGFRLMTEKEIDSFEELAESITWSFYFPLTNDTELEFSDGDDLLSRLEFKEISNAEFEFLNKIFPEGFGVFIEKEFLETEIDNENDYTEDEDDEDGNDFDDDY